MIYPWLNDTWRRVWQQCQADRLPHALMLTGMRGLGKLAFARHLSASLLCGAVDEAGNPCGQCHDCRLIANEVHPSFLNIVPEKANQAIKIDQVRLANEFAFQSTLKGKTRVILFDPADQLNLNAANALLKTLEEPAPDVIMILICHQAGRLPATIQSRCQQLIFNPPPKTAALDWLLAQNIQAAIPLTVLLNLAHGAPLQAVQLAAEEWETRRKFYDALLSLARREGDALTYAEQFQKQELSLLLDLNISLLTDFMRVKLGVNADTILNSDRISDVKTLVSKTNLSLLSTFMAQCSTWQKQLWAGFQLNKTLILETLFYRWMECVGCL